MEDYRELRAQKLNTAGDKEKGRLVSDAIIPVCREAAGEGIVLLKNVNDTLPLAGSDRVAVFGRTQIDYFAVGYGSGGDVLAPYTVNVIDGLENAGVRVDETLLGIYRKWTEDRVNTPVFDGIWGHWPLYYPEMPLREDIVKKAAGDNDIALVVIGRTAGEDRESRLEKGSYYLTSEEMRMLTLVTRHFSRTAVIIDAGNVIDMSWTGEFGDRIGAVVYAWQGGMESGNALSDILTGRVNPSGKLTDTIAVSYSSLPSADSFGGTEYNNYTEDIYVGYRYFETFRKDDVLYPFGFGLSYTTFAIEASAVSLEHIITVTARVRNTGVRSGKETVQVYLSSPSGMLGKPEKVLVSYSKTGELSPGGEEILTLIFNLWDFASYDDTGATGNRNSFVLEKGEYRIYTGTSVRDCTLTLSIVLDEDEVVKRTHDVLGVKKGCGFSRLVERGGQAVYEPVEEEEENLGERILASLPSSLKENGETELTFDDVRSGRCPLSSFVATLSPEDLEALSRGEGAMNSPLGTEGNGGAFAGVTESLRKKGIPPVIVSDGPAGLRVRRTSALLPSGTALASTFNDSLVRKLYAFVADEMISYGVDVLLAPGMNIHRNPLCGRNFEYFSEDPLLSGTIAADIVSALEEKGVTCSPKHFAANNQEQWRTENDSRVSQRALREIYLKAFEIMIDKSHPLIIMTSYNRLNGVWNHYNYDLVHTVLREEWGFDGLVITDWWMHAFRSPEFPLLENDAYRVRSDVDVLMPGGDGYNTSSCVGRTLLDTLGMKDGITKGELQRTALHVLSFILKMEKMKNK